jgi:hypothetical protein
MFETSQKFTGTQYTATVALVAAAVIASPAVLLMSSPLGPVSYSIAVGCSGVCLVLAWFNWKRNSRLTMPSIEAPSLRGK